MMLRWEVCEKVYGISLNILNLRHSKNIGNMSWGHFVVWVVDRIFWYAVVIAELSMLVRGGKKWVVFRESVQQVAISAPRKVRENKPRDAGMNWSNMFLVIRVIFLFFLSFWGRGGWGWLLG